MRREFTKPTLRHISHDVRVVDIPFTAFDLILGLRQCPTRVIELLSGWIDSSNSRSTRTKDPSKGLLLFGQAVFALCLDAPLSHCDTNAMYHIVAVSITIPHRRQRLGMAGLVAGASSDHVCSCAERRIDRPRSRGKTPSTRS